MIRVENYLTKHPREKRNPAVIAYLASLDHIESTSPHIANSIIQELHDERSHIKLIASENFSSLAVQLAMGNLLTDKYA
ncbi:MAG TPA: glycine hydroxymethyltransferase, partial [Waddliaceae bacterium]